MNGNPEGIKPEFSRKEDEIAKKVGDQVTSAIKDTIKEEMDPIRNKVEDLDKKVSSNAGISPLPVNDVDKISNIINRAKSKRTRLHDISINDPSLVKDQKEEEDHHHKPSTSFSCPTCHKHEIKVNSNKMTGVCTGEGCNAEVAIVPKNSDFKCLNCGIPIKKPKEGSLEGCPFCGNDKATEFDWSPIKGKR